MQPSWRGREWERNMNIKAIFCWVSFSFPDEIKTNILCEDNLKRVKNRILWFFYQQINNNQQQINSHELDQPFQIFLSGNVTTNFCHLDVHKPISWSWWIRWSRRLWWLRTLPAGEKNFHSSTSIQAFSGVQETSLWWSLRWTLWWLWQIKVFWYNYLRRNFSELKTIKWWNKTCIWIFIAVLFFLQS